MPDPGAQRAGQSKEPVVILSLPVLTVRLTKRDRLSINVCSRRSAGLGQIVICPLHEGATICTCEVEDPRTLHRQLLPQPDGGGAAEVVRSAHRSALGRNEAGGAGEPPCDPCHEGDRPRYLRWLSAGEPPCDPCHEGDRLDISGGYPKTVDGFLYEEIDYVITVCGDADENCPVFQGNVGRRMHIGFPDPAEATGAEEEILGVFRQSRDDIQAKFHELYQSELKTKLDAAS